MDINPTNVIAFRLYAPGHPTVRPQTIDELISAGFFEQLHARSAASDVVETASWAHDEAADFDNDLTSSFEEVCAALFAHVEALSRQAADEEWAEELASAGGDPRRTESYADWRRGDR